jgi:hypothetical protein
MASRLGLFEIHCDAPPYEIVQACEGTAFRSPLDVRWVRRDHFLNAQAAWGRWVWHRPWKILLGWGGPRTPGCSCGNALPALTKVAFTFLGEAAGDLLLGQCPRCLTVFWEEA